MKEKQQEDSNEVDAGISQSSGEVQSEQVEPGSGSELTDKLADRKQRKSKISPLLSNPLFRNPDGSVPADFYTLRKDKSEKVDK